MKIAGIRKLDELGRIALPMELRRKLKLLEGDEVSICLNENNEIVIKPASPVCTLCHGTENLTVIDGMNLCKQCCNKITAHTVRNSCLIRNELFIQP